MLQASVSVLATHVACVIYLLRKPSLWLLCAALCFFTFGVSSLHNLIRVRLYNVLTVVLTVGLKWWNNAHAGKQGVQVIPIETFNLQLTVWPATVDVHISAIMYRIKPCPSENIWSVRMLATVCSLTGLSAWQRWVAVQMEVPCSLSFFGIHLGGQADSRYVSRVVQNILYLFML